jgi:hypothetical protein
MPSPPYTIAPSANERYDLLLTSTTATASQEECVICNEPLCADPELEPMALKACGHAFHDACILAVTKEKSSCPLCRVEIFAPEKKMFSVPFVFGGEEVLVSEGVMREMERSCGKEVVGDWEEFAGEKWAVRVEVVFDPLPRLAFWDEDSEKEDEDAEVYKGEVLGEKPGVSW